MSPLWAVSIIQRKRKFNHEIFNNEDAWNYSDEEFKPPAESEEVIDTGTSRPVAPSVRTTDSALNQSTIPGEAT